MILATLNVKWHFHHKGDPSETPILFLHGFMSHGRIWTPTIEQLPARMYAVAVDLPGHGETVADLSQLDFDTLSEALADFIRTHFSKPPVVVGYSMGGRIALYTALKYPDRIAAMVLESSTAGIEDAVEREKRLMLDKARARDLQQNGVRAYLTDWYEQPLFASLKRRPGLVESIIQKKLGNDPDDLAKVIVNLSPGNQPSLWDKLDQWTKPTLLMAGELDDKLCDIARRMAERMPHAELKIIGDAGHIVHLENNKDFVAALNFFLTTYIL